MKKLSERDADMLESIEMWLHEIEPKFVKKELEWLNQLRSRLLSEEPDKSLERYASRAGFDYVDGIVQEEPGHRWNDHDVEFAYRDGIIAGAEWAFRQGWTFDAHKGAFGICFDRDIDNLLDSLKDEEEVTVQIRKK